MTIEGYFDGTAVKPLEPVNLKPQQKVYIQIPEQTENKKSKQEKWSELQKFLDEAKEAHSEDEELRKIRQKQAIDDLFNLLSDDEAKAFGEAMKETLHFKNVEFA